MSDIPKLKYPKGDKVFSRPHKYREKVTQLGRAEFKLMNSHLLNKRTCLDIGANIGITTLRFAKHFEWVHSFEPVVFDCLVENTKHLSNVTSHQYAVTDRSGEIEIYPNPNNSMLSIIDNEETNFVIKKRYVDGELNDVKPISVPCVDIDSFAFEDVDLIKIDVEGHILPVIMGLKQTLSNNTPIVQVEMFNIPQFQNVNEKVHSMLVQLEYKHFDSVNRGKQNDRFYKKQ